MKVKDDGTVEVDYDAVSIDLPEDPSFKCIFNQHGFVGQIKFDSEVNKFRGVTNPWTQKLFKKKFGYVECDTFEECVIELINMHVVTFHLNKTNLETNNES